MANFAAIADRYGEIVAPLDGYSEWNSPYRLLGGAAFSIGCAERIGDGRENRFDWALIRQTVDSGQWWRTEQDWSRTWLSSFMLTNAIFRVASATEKMCYLADSTLGSERQQLWAACRNESSTLCTRSRSVWTFLGNIPSRNNRDSFLETRKTGFDPNIALDFPLILSFIQTDLDKHVPLVPTKALGFYRAMSTESILQACDIWDELTS